MGDITIIAIKKLSSRKSGGESSRYHIPFVLGYRRTIAKVDAIKEIILKNEKKINSFPDMIEFPSFGIEDLEFMESVEATT